MITAETETMRYFYVIHGTIPELTPDVLYRRENGAPPGERKMLRCPLCGMRLTDTDAATRVELYRHPIRVQRTCQFYMKCSYCKSEIGINIAV